MAVTARLMCLLALSISIKVGCAQPSNQVPVQSLVKIAHGFDEDPLIIALETTPNHKLLAVLLQGKTEAAVILYDRNLQPVKRVTLDRRAKHLALDEANLYFSVTRSVIKEKMIDGVTVACRLELNSQAQKCLDLPREPQQLLVADGIPHAVVGQNIEALNFEIGSRQFVHNYSQSKYDASWNISSDGNLIVGANPETGAAFGCRVPEWKCNSFELLSPDHKAALPTKHPSEGLYVNLFLNQSTVFVRPGRQSPRNGYLLNVFDTSGKYTKPILLNLPQLSAVEPTEKNKALDPKLSQLFLSWVAGMGTRIIGIDNRTLTLVVYDPNSSTP